MIDDNSTDINRINNLIKIINENNVEIYMKKIDEKRKRYKFFNYIKDFFKDNKKEISEYVSLNIDKIIQDGWIEHTFKGGFNEDKYSDIIEIFNSEISEDNYIKFEDKYRKKIREFISIFSYIINSITI